MPHVPDSLRIALVCLHTSPVSEPGSGDAGGMNVLVRHQAEVMASRGHAVDILTRRSSSEMPSSIELAPGLTLRFLDAGPADPVPKGDHEAFIDAFRASASVFGPYDIIHSHHWFSGMAALPLALQRGIPHVQSFHSIAAHDSAPLSDGERAESSGRLAGEAWLAQHSDAVIAISRSEADTVVKRLGGHPERITVVPPGVDGTLFHPRAARQKDEPAELGLEPELESVAEPPGCGYVVVAGRLQPLKGFDLAIEAIAAMPQQLRPELVVAGDVSVDFDKYAAELRRLAARGGIARSVRFVGPQSRVELAALLREARVVLIPSHSETYGLAALEAAASGVPVVAAASGGLREAVVHGHTGLVLDSREPRVWAAAISRILANPEYSRELSKAAREHAERLDWSRSADGLLAVYRHLVFAAGAVYRRRRA